MPLLPTQGNTCNATALEPGPESAFPACTVSFVASMAPDAIIYSSLRPVAAEKRREVTKDGSRETWPSLASSVEERSRPSRRQK
eukprot:2946923-Amphidinium_carterae.1